MYARKFNATHFWLIELSTQLDFHRELNFCKMMRLQLSLYLLSVMFTLLAEDLYNNALK